MRNEVHREYFDKSLRDLHWKNVERTHRVRESYARRAAKQIVKRVNYHKAYQVTPIGKQIVLDLLETEIYRWIDKYQVDESHREFCKSLVLDYLLGAPKLRPGTPVVLESGFPVLGRVYSGELPQVKGGVTGAVTPKVAPLAVLPPVRKAAKPAEPVRVVEKPQLVVKTFAALKAAE